MQPKPHATHKKRKRQVGPTTSLSIWLRFVNLDPNLVYSLIKMRELRSRVVHSQHNPALSLLVINNHNQFGFPTSKERKHKISIRISYDHPILCTYGGSFPCSTLRLSASLPQQSIAFASASITTLLYQSSIVNEIAKSSETNYDHIVQKTTTGFDL